MTLDVRPNDAGCQTSRGDSTRGGELVCQPSWDAHCSADAVTWPSKFRNLVYQYLLGSEDWARYSKVDKQARGPSAKSPVINIQKQFVRIAVCLRIQVVEGAKETIILSTLTLTKDNMACPCKGIAATDKTAHLTPWEFERRALRDDDVKLKIEYAGMCHSDYHTITAEWGDVEYPIVPGHEIVGEVLEVGAKVTKFKKGDKAAVGVIVDSCRTCALCKSGKEIYCTSAEKTFTYNSKEKISGEMTQGGYSTLIVTPEYFVHHVPKSLSSDPKKFAATAPLLCAGITTYSPLVRAGIKAGDHLGVVGLGGLGHMAVKFGVAMGANVTVLSHSSGKEATAKRLGAHAFVNTTDKEAMKAAAFSLDAIIDTVSAEHDVESLVGLIRPLGTYIQVGIPPKPISLPPFSLVLYGIQFVGSCVGGVPETQAMLDFCGEKGIVSDIDLIPCSKVNEAMKTLGSGAVGSSGGASRFVLDMSTLA
eukprot:jgi/Mesvir1/26958/Mv20676-RA.1